MNNQLTQVFTYSDSEYYDAHTRYHAVRSILRTKGGFETLKEVIFDKLEDFWYIEISEKGMNILKAFYEEHKG
jgi:hypothetical protein